MTNTTCRPNILCGQGSRRALTGLPSSLPVLHTPILRAVLLALQGTTSPRSVLSAIAVGRSSANGWMLASRNLWSSVTTGRRPRMLGRGPGPFPGRPVFLILCSVVVWSPSLSSLPGPVLMHWMVVGGSSVAACRLPGRCWDLRLALAALPVSARGTLGLLSLLSLAGNFSSQPYKLPHGLQQLTVPSDAVLFQIQDPLQEVFSERLRLGPLLEGVPEVLDCLKDFVLSGMCSFLETHDPFQESILSCRRISPSGEVLECG